MHSLRRAGRALQVELCKMFTQRSTYAGFIIIALVIGLIVYGTWRHGTRMDELGRLGSERFVVAGKALTAPFVMQFVLPSVMEVLMALLVAAVGGGLIAAEVRSGTLRTLLMRPVTRLELLLAKVGAGWVYALFLSLFAGLTAAALGYLVFGEGDLVSIITGRIVIFSHEEALARLGMAYGFAALGRCAIITVAIMLSCLFDNALTAGAVTVASLLCFRILGEIPYFDTWEPYFLTTHLDVYLDPLKAELDWNDVLRHVGGLACYVVGALAVAGVVFWRRDITT
ncbi:MAG: ABC transporter permease [Armatimonadetes bacterium]|nr:ABC transporter permease [Armatimonadota bacterium]